MDATKIEHLSENISIQTYCGMIETNQLKLKHSFDKNSKDWTIEQKSRYIESLILGFPINPIAIIKVRSEKVLTILDGLQRLKAITEFINGEFKLENLTFLNFLNGLNYSELNAAERRQITSKFIFTNKFKTNYTEETEEKEFMNEISNRISF